MTTVAPTRVDVSISELLSDGDSVEQGTADAPTGADAEASSTETTAPPSAAVAAEASVAEPLPPPPAPALSSPAPSSPPPPSTPWAGNTGTGAAGPWSLVTDAWSRTRSLWVGVAVGLLAVGLLVSLIGLFDASFGSVYKISAYHGQIWASFGAVLAVVALAAAAAARTQLAVWSKELDLKVGAALAGVALLIGLIGLIVDLTAGAGRASLSGPVWASFASIWAFGAFAWVVFSRPVGRAQGLTIGVRSAAVALVLAVIGLAVGLGDTSSSIVHSEGWFGWASTWALVAAAAVFGREPAA